jgi:hypothetical protein
MSDFPLSVLWTVVLCEFDSSPNYWTKVYVFKSKSIFMSTLIFKCCWQCRDYGLMWSVLMLACSCLSTFHVLVTGPSILAYIFIQNQQMHQNDHFMLMSSQTLLHVSAYQRHHQGVHMILTSYLYIGVHYRKNNGIWSKIVPVGIVTLWIQVGMANCCWKQWTVVEHDPKCTTKCTHLYP